MYMPPKFGPRPSNLITFGLLFIFILLIYSNSFQASWHLDDYHNIVNNPHLKINDLKPATLWQTLHAWHSQGAYDSARLYRPVPCLTFALNWYVGLGNVFGFHLVNVLVHFITACFIYFTIVALLHTPYLLGRFAGREHFIALLAAVFWAANPIQTQGVTYIVQRMASMAAMFYIMGMFCYIQGRLEIISIRRRWGFFVGAGLLFLMAIGSKENAVLWPASIFLIETAFFQDLSCPRRRLKLLGGTVAVLLGILIIGVFYFWDGNFQGILNGYNNRPYTLTERFMTQFRVLIFYLSQIFYPIPQRLSVEHDLIASASLIDPWTTLPAILAVAGLVFGSLFKIHKQPIICFAILFFFLNHAIESSILGLEMIFEHRNYLPSAFLFFPVAVVFDHLLQKYRTDNRSMYILLAAFIPLVLIGFGVGTLTRNLVWSTEKTLWEDALAKSPGTARPYHNLAWAYYSKTGQDLKAIEYYKIALEKRFHHNGTRQTLLGNIAGTHYRLRNYDQAVEWWYRSLDYFSNNELIRYRLSAGLIRTGEFEDALKQLDWLVRKRRDHSGYWERRGYVLLKLERYQEARQSLQTALKFSPDSKLALINLGACLNLMGEQRTSELYLRKAIAKVPKNATTLLWLIKTNLESGDTKETRYYLARLFEVLDVIRLDFYLRTQSEASFVLFPRSEILYQKIARVLQKKSENIAGIAWPKIAPHPPAALSTPEKTSVSPVGHDAATPIAAMKRKSKDVSGK